MTTRRGVRSSPESSSTAAAAETSAEERRTALEALAALGGEDREALLLVSWDGLSVTEAGTVLGVRPATLRVRLHRARSRLEAIHHEMSAEEASWQTS